MTHSFVSTSERVWTTGVRRRMSCTGGRGGIFAIGWKVFVGKKEKGKKEVLSGKVGDLSHTSSVAKRSGSAVGVQGTVGRLAVTNDTVGAAVSGLSCK